MCGNNNIIKYHINIYLKQFNDSSLIKTKHKKKGQELLRRGRGVLKCLKLKKNSL
jgi:hypothetical protein